VKRRSPTDNPGLPDYSDFVVVSVPGLRDGRHW
jgi:hypothetical protein